MVTSSEILTKRTSKAFHSLPQSSKIFMHLKNLVGHLTFKMSNCPCLTDLFTLLERWCQLKGHWTFENIYTYIYIYIYRINCQKNGWKLDWKKKKEAEANTNNCTNLQRMLPCCHCCQISALKVMSSREKLSLYKFLHSITNLRQQGKKVL